MHESDLIDEALAQRVWEHPSDYGGFSPDGDYVVCTRHRDSGTVARSNYQVAFRELRKVCEDFPDAPEEPFPDRGGLSPRSGGWVYDWCASHWAVGWVEYLMVRADAPQAVLQEAARIVASIEDYPVLDDDHHSQMEWDEITEYWASCSVRDRLELIKDSGSRVSPFAARRDSFPEDDDNGALYNHLRD